jgi:hypothetical protein
MQGQCLESGLKVEATGQMEQRLGEGERGNSSEARERRPVNETSTNNMTCLFL